MKGWVKAAGALAEVMFDRDAGRPPPDRIAWLQHELEDFMARAGARSNLVFRGALFLIGLVAPLLVLRPWPLRFQPAPTRAKALARFEAGPFGLALFAVKAVLCILYFEHPDSLAEIGVREGPGGSPSPLAAKTAGADGRRECLR